MSTRGATDTHPADAAPPQDHPRPIGWREALQHRITTREAQRLLRRTEAPPPGLIDLASNDYLDLRQDRRLADAAADAARFVGVGAGASRLISGTTDLHRCVESRFADFKGAEAALILPTGYHANLALLSAVPRSGDLILLDRLCHASLIDAALLARAHRPSIAVRRFGHGAVHAARRLARRHLERTPGATVWLVSDSVFSMDGDIAPIADLARLRDEINTAGVGAGCLILDEAHATGVLGATGAGADEVFGHVADICISTASKALGSLGGIITGPGVVIDAVVNFARPFIYTTATPPPMLAAINAALDIIESSSRQRERVGALARTLRAALTGAGWPAASLGDHPVPIVPLVVGDPESALALSQRLQNAGFFAPAIRPPSVPVGADRVRVSVRASLRDADLDRLIVAIPPYDEEVSSGR